MQNFIVREFETSDVIFSEGSPGDTAYVLKAGRVEIFTRTNGKKIVLAELTPITIFGEMAFCQLNKSAWPPRVHSVMWR